MRLILIVVLIQSGKLPRCGHSVLHVESIAVQSKAFNCVVCVEVTDMLDCCCAEDWPSCTVWK